MRIEDIIAFKKKGHENDNFIEIPVNDSNSLIKNATLLYPHKWYSFTGLAIRYLKWRYQ